MRFAPIGGGRREEGEAFYSREERFAFLRRGGKVTCKGPARSPRASQENGGGMNISRVNIPR